MPDPQEAAFMDLLLSNLPGSCTGAMVILVYDGGHAEVGAAGLLMSDENKMMVCFNLAYEISIELKGSGRYPADVPQPNGKPTIYLPPDLQRKLRDL